MTERPGFADEALLRRFRSAAGEIAWRPAPSRRAEIEARIAHLHDEEARIERRPLPDGEEWVVDSGPVGALVLLVEIDRSGALPRLSTLESGADPQFPSGALVGRWPATDAGGSTVPLSDLVRLARYALR